MTISALTPQSYEIFQRVLAPGITPRPPTNVPVTGSDLDAFRNVSVDKKLKKMDDWLSEL